MLNRQGTKRRWFSLSSQVIVFASLFLMALPWLGYRYIDEMKEYLVSGQGDAQQLAAEAIAMVLRDRGDLFGMAELPEGLLAEESAIYVYPLDTGIVLDGYGSDWGDLLSQRREYAAGSLVYDRTAGAYPPVSFGLLLGDNREYLFGLLNVTDGSVVYRHPGYARLDSSDHVRIELVDAQGETRRYGLFAEAPGIVSIYEMQPDWVRAVTGKPVYTMSGIWMDRPYGYDVEFRLPWRWLNARQQLVISVADVNSDSERRIDNIVATLPGPESGSLNKLVKRSPELERIVRGLGDAETGICIVDQYRRVRALAGEGARAGGLCSMTDKVAPELVSASLGGERSISRQVQPGGGEIVVASHPVYRDGAVAGVVLVEKSSDDILGGQRKTLIRVILATAAVFAAALVGLLLFSGVLAYRLRSLQREVSSSIDANGRLLATVINSSRNAGDELGELSRGVSGLLSQLQSYTGFLESVPRTLRHEILNPLNTISMCMQKLDASGEYDASLVDSAAGAMRQLEIIVQTLTEAAHIDDALMQDERELISLGGLLSEYVVNIRRKHPGKDIALAVPREDLQVRGSDIRISQMLDKLKDNAIDFADPDTGIEFVLRKEAGMARLSVCNNGPPIPADIAGYLCKGIISRRSASPGEPHLGIGLYVASRIAQHHDGSLHIYNKLGRDGVCAVVKLPLA